MDTRYLRDHAQTRGFMLGRPVKATPTPDGSAVLFLRSQPRQAKMALFEFDVATGKTRELLTPEQLLKGAEENLSPEEKARRERQRVSVGGFTTFQLDEKGDNILLSLSGRLYLVDRKSGKSRELATGKGALVDPKFSPDGKKVGYVLDYDLHVFDLERNQELKLTSSGRPELTHGLAEFVAQEEMGRFTGYWWSPDSGSILYQTTDAAGVEVWHVADPIRPEQTPHPFFYPRPGKSNVKVNLTVERMGAVPLFPKWDAKEYPYLVSARWPKDGPMLITVQNREQTKLAVLAPRPFDGATDLVVAENDAAWVNIHQDMPRWISRETGILWITEANGGPELVLRSPKGTTTLVAADRGFQSLQGVDGDTKTVLVTVGKTGSESQLLRINWETKAEEVLSKEPGLFGATLAKNGSIYVQTARTPGTMPITTVHKGDGTLIGEIPSVAEEPPHRPRVEYLEVGDKKFQAAVVLPRDFDASKKYPVMVDVYGGPHHVHVVASQQRWLLDQWYADQGFIVVAIDGRGIPGRGRDWERAIYKKFGSVPLADQVAGLQALAQKYPAMDLTRVGIDGWSFGGYLAAQAVLKRPDVFHCAVAGAPVTDWYDYDTHYTERYLGIPPKDAAAYEDASLLPLAKDLRRPLLILHGTADDNVYFRHSLKLVDALFRAGKDFEMLPLSGLTHMVPDPVVMESLHGRIARFLQKHLGGPR